MNAEFEAVDQHLSEYVVNVSRTGHSSDPKDPLPVGNAGKRSFFPPARRN